MNKGDIACLLLGAGMSFLFFQRDSKADKLNLYIDHAARKACRIRNETEDYGEDNDRKKIHEFSIVLVDKLNNLKGFPPSFMNKKGTRQRFLEIKEDVLNLGVQVRIYNKDLPEEKRVDREQARKLLYRTISLGDFLGYASA